MKRVLQLPDSIEKRNGRMSVIMSVYRKLDKSKIQFDFLATDYGFDNYYNEIRKLGGRVFLISHKELSEKNIILKFRDVINKSDYDYLHYHALSKWGICVPIANKKGIKTIIQSHATKLSSSILKSFRNRVYYWLFLRNAYKRVAISPEAGRNFFLSKKYTYIPNMINVNNFIFDKNNRKKIRNKYSISERIRVIGMVGRVSKQKNILFALKAFNNLVQENNNYRLMIVGSINSDNADKNYYKRLVKYISKHNLNNKVIFTDMVLNIGEYYSAFDIFWMTSFFEGMPTAAIEAQANGLPVLVSNKITKSMRIVKSIRYLPLKNKLNLWVDCTISFLKVGRERDIIQKFKDSPFNEQKVVNEWIKLYSAL